MKKSNNPLNITPKGIAMGIADVIPGVSGGTLALLLGIYERFIGALKGVNIVLIKKIIGNANISKQENRRNLLNTLTEFDCLFLIYLISGIGIAIAIASKIIPELMIKHTPETLGLFVGLILPSISVPFKSIKTHNLNSWLFMIIGIALAVSGSIIMQHYGTLIGNNYSYWTTAFIVIGSAMIAICAMILPGISGSYLLLLLGQYFFVLGIVGRLLSDLLGKDPAKHADALLLVSRFSTMEVFGLACCFGIGALLGLITFSRAINWGLNRFHDTSMGALTGMVMGSLYVLWPFKIIPSIEKLKSLHIDPLEKVKWLPMASNYIPRSNELLMPGVFFIVGILLSMGLIWWGKKSN